MAVFGEKSALGARKEPADPAAAASRIAVDVGVEAKHSPFRIPHFPIGSPLHPFTPSPVPADWRAAGLRYHAYNFYLSISALLVTQVLLSLGFGKEPRWRSFQITSFVLTSLLVLAYVLQFIAIMQSSQEGLVNRFFGVVWIAWLVATSLRLRRLDRTQQPQL